MCCSHPRQPHLLVGHSGPIHSTNLPKLQPALLHVLQQTWGGLALGFTSLMDRKAIPKAALLSAPKAKGTAEWKKTLFYIIYKFLVTKPFQSLQLNIRERLTSNKIYLDEQEALQRKKKNNKKTRNAVKSDNYSEVKSTVNGCWKWLN